MLLMLMERATRSQSGRPTLQATPRRNAADAADSDTVVVTITVEDLAEDPQIVVPDPNLLGGFIEDCCRHHHRRRDFYGNPWRSRPRQ